MKNKTSSNQLNFTQLQKNIPINEANFVRLHLLQTVKEELELKKLTSNNFFVNRVSEIIIEKESSKELEKKLLRINIDSDDESYDDEEINSSIDISCEEEEIYNFK